MLALRPSQTLAIGPLLRSRTYATQTGLGASSSPTARRRKVTAFNDDGFVPWSELSATEKASRATQQSFNLGLILVGIALTVSPSMRLLRDHVSPVSNICIQGGVGYFLWNDVFSPDSKTSQFNRALNKIKDDRRCVELLGSPKKISAHGDETFNKWRRARPIS